MADAYSGRLIGRLVNLATLLDKNGYRTESTMIRTLIGRVNNWKDGYEWNDSNPLSTPDADYVLEEMVKTFTFAVNEIAKKKLVQKQKQPEAVDSNNNSESETAIKELETAIEGLF